MADLELRNVVKRFGAVQVIHGVDLEIGHGEFVVFVGPSGCGKSTLLRMIAGLEGISGGEIRIAGDVVNEMPAARRGLAMVFQSYALYPHMSVRKNLAFGLETMKVPKDEIAAKVKQAADILQIGELLERKPGQLSGGQRQRVAIGRAIVREPRIFLFDEPLSNLDAALRVATRIEIAKLHERMHRTTMIYVTHDQVEAMTLADRIVVLNAGRVEQVGSPMELYHRPDNLFVARFIGSPAMNTVPAKVEAGGAPASFRTLDGAPFRAHVDVPASAAGTEVTLGVRPEDLEPTDGPALFTGPVSIVEKLGEVTLLYVEIGHDEPLVVKVDGDASYERGQTISVGASIEHLHVFDANGRAYARLPAAAAA